MNDIPCGDCGKMLAHDAKGCPVCGRNLAAERKLARIFLCGVAAALVVLLAAWFLIGRT